MNIFLDWNINVVNIIIDLIIIILTTGITHYLFSDIQIIRQINKITNLKNPLK